MKDKPCLNCKERHTLCWNDCELYLEAKARNEKNKQSLADKRYYIYAHETITRTIRKKRNGKL